MTQNLQTTEKKSKVDPEEGANQLNKIHRWSAQKPINKTKIHPSKAATTIRYVSE